LFTNYSLIVVLGEILGGRSVHACHDNVIALIRLECHLVDGAELLLSQDLHFVGVNHLGRGGGVDARCLDGDHEVAAVLHEHGGVESKNTGLIGLGDIGEDDIAHRHEHSVLLGVTGILNNGDDVGALLGHVDKVATDTLGELHSVNGTLWTNKVGHVGHGSA